MTSPIQTSPWQLATVEKIVPETPGVKTFTFRLPNWTTFRAGQHFDVRLTAPDGYQAQRSYSIATAPETKGTIDLTIELMEDGEVSPYFHEVVQPGDEIELRGPIGGPFTWTKGMGGPLFLVAGGSGVVPIMSILRHKRAVGPDVQAVLLFSSRSYESIIYRDELDNIEASDPNVTIIHTLTRSQPQGWKGYSRRIDKAMLRETLDRFDATPLVYVCASTGFVEAVSDGLISLGVPPDNIRTERFGPTG
jgi:ferredoxin-NADP reductase